MTGQKRLPRGGTGAVLVVALGLLGVWLIGPPPGSGAALANRPMAEFPVITAAGLVDATTYVQAEAAFTDRVRFKPLAVAGVNRAVLAISARSPSAQVVAEGDQWFYAGEFTEPCPYVGAAQAAAIGMQNLKSAAEQGGKRVLFVVVPNKSTTLADQIPKPQQSLQECATPNRAALQSLAAEPESIVSLVSPDRVLDIAGADAYWPHDTHWTTSGGRALTEQLALEFGRPRDADDYMRSIQISGAVEHAEDLRPLLGLTGTVETPRWEPAAMSEFTTVDGLSDWQPRTFTSPDPLPGAPTAAFVYDSFVYAPQLEPQLTSIFPSGVMVQWDAVAALPQLPLTEVVIMESTERLALGRLAGIQPGGPLQPLLDYLATPAPSAKR